jgi:hypothetical protein
MSRTHLSVVLTLLAMIGAAPYAVGPGATGEGIQVRGQWRLAVRNADRSIARQVTFDNALLSGGGEALVQLLYGSRSPVGWQIRLEGLESSKYYIASPWFQDAFGIEVFPTLTTRVIVKLPGGPGFGWPPGYAPDPTCPSGCFEVGGTATADRRSTISKVHTSLSTCILDQVEGVICAGPFLQGHPFSEATVPGGLSVAADQTVEVTVRYTFGPAPHAAPPSH